MTHINTGIEAVDTEINSDLDAIMIIEEEMVDHDTYVACFQQLYNTGTWKHLQGFYQRTMVQMIEQGLIEQGVLEA